MEITAAVMRRANAPLSIEKVELDDPGPGEVLVELVASGVCHTDLHAALGHFPLPLPIVLGHEGAGIVRATGPGVTTVAPGDHVVLAATASCGSCDRCTAGEPFLCQRSFAAMEGGTLLNGEVRLHKGNERIHHLFGQSSFAEYAVVHEGTAVQVPPDAPLRVAALLACGATTGIGAVVNTAGVRPGETVAVFGCGGVGLSAVMGATLVAAGEIIAVDILQWKLDLARTLGATVLVDAAHEDPVAAILRCTHGGADYAFECIGSVEVMAQAYQAVRPGGKAVICGAAPTGSRLTIDPDPLLQGKAIVGSAAGSTRFRVDVPRLLHLHQRGRLPLDRLISGVYPLAKVNEALAALHSGQAIRSIIEFRKE